MSEFSEGPESPVISRRSALRKGAAGVGVAGAVWVTPLVLSLDVAHANGTVACDDSPPFVWVTRYGVGTVGATAGGPPPTSRSLTPALWSAVTVSPTASDPFSQIAQTGGEWRIRTAGEANWHLTQSQQLDTATQQSSFLKSRMGQGTIADAGRSYTNTLAFSVPVRDLRFSILDIDTNNPGNQTAYRDIVTVAGSGPSGPVSFIILYQGSAVSGGGVTGDPFWGNALVADTENSPTNTGNVSICFVEPVTSVSVTHARGNTNPPGAGGTPLFGGQHIGISDLTWCPDV